MANNLKVYDDSKNYTAQVVKLPAKQKLKGLDNLVGVSVMGQLCLIQADYPEDELYLFFTSGTKLSPIYCSSNNLYRHSDLNTNPEKTGYLDDNGRVKSIKFKGHVSTGIVMPASSLWVMNNNVPPTNALIVGQEFNELNDVEICRKYIVPTKNPGAKVDKEFSKAVDDKFFPEHINTAHFLKFVDDIDIYEQCIITEKLHGTSARTAYTLVPRKLNWLERLAKRIGIQVVEEEYKYVVGSRRCIKSIDFQGLPGKNHYYPTDLWTTTAKKYLKDRLYKGEAFYYEIVGKEDGNGGEIQKGYSYGYEQPVMYVYRITNINPQGIETDLTFEQMEKRCEELGFKTVPVIYDQPILEYVHRRVDQEELIPTEVSKWIQDEFGNIQSSLDNKTLMEGVCIRFEGYPHPKVYKYKSPLFLLHESKLADEGVDDAETCN